MIINPIIRNVQSVYMIQNHVRRFFHMKKRYIVWLLLLLFSFSNGVKAMESGDLGNYSFKESSSKTNYAKLEFTDGTILLMEFDSSNDATLIKKIKDQISDGNFDTINTMNAGNGFLFAYQNEDDTYEVKKKKYEVPKRGDVSAFVESSDSSLVYTTRLYFFYESGAAEFPIIGHIIEGLEHCGSIPNGSMISSVRFVKVTKKSTPSKDSGGKHVPDAGTSYCSGEFLKPFRFVGKIFSIFKILIPILIIGFGSFDFFKALIANKDDEIKKSARSLLFRVVSGIIIFFIPTIINLVFSLVDDWNQYATDYRNCSKCLVSPHNC